MKKTYEKLKNKFYYSTESIKNRYPCKIIKIKNHLDLEQEARITYQAVTRLNLRESHVHEILDDPMIIEKFHPTDAIKLGFLAAGEILLKKHKTLEAIQKDYQKIIYEMFKGMDTKQ